MSERIRRIRDHLERAFEPMELDVVDDSHKHVGHAGARTGMGHFTVVIRAARFRKADPLTRHRMIYEALGEMMQTDIHALSIRAYAPEE